MKYKRKKNYTRLDVHRNSIMPGYLLLTLHVKGDHGNTLRITREPCGELRGTLQVFLPGLRSDLATATLEPWECEHYLRQIFAGWGGN